MESCNTESSLDLPLESLSLQPFLQSLHKEQWQEVRLGEIVDVKHGYAFAGKNITTEHTPNVLVTPGNFHIGGGFKSQKFKYFNGEIPKSFIFSTGDIIVTMTDLSKDGDTLGYSAKIPKDSEHIYLHNQRIGLLLFLRSDICKDFIYWLLRTKNYQAFIVNSATGTSVKHTSPKLIGEYRFPLPPLTIQQKIAEILSSFDDKIDLLHRQNKTLESLALTLFRHYFIDNPKRDEWELGKLGDYVKIIDNRGKTPPFTTDITPYPLIEVNALSDDSMLINYDIVRKYVIKETYQKWFREHIKQYDILFSTVGSIGEVAMLLDNKGCIAQNVIGFRARDISPFYLYEWLKYMQQEIKEFDIGSVQPSIKVTHFIEKQIYKPDSKILESFDKQMLLMTNKISHNAKQIQNLQAMRDMLLKAIFA